MLSDWLMYMTQNIYKIKKINKCTTEWGIKKFFKSTYETTEI